MMFDLSSVILGWASVPIPASIDIKDIEFILDHAEVTALTTSKIILSRILPLLPALPKLRLIIVMDKVSSEEYDSYCSALSTTHEVKHSEIRSSSSVPPTQSNGSSQPQKTRPSITIVDFEDTILIGKEHTLKSPNLPENEESTIVTIVYTSGSTGRPKGAVNVYGRWNKFITFLYSMSSPLVRLSFMPLAHNTERQQSHLTTLYGGKMCFSRGDMSRIFEEFALVNPTTLSAAPRFYDSIYSQYQATLSQFKKDYPQYLPSYAEQYCLDQYKGILGNAMQILIVGGAAVSPWTKEFLHKCFRLTIFDGYGTTEAGGIAADGKLYPNTQVQIVDCPDLGYTKDDKPWPRGEVWAKTNTMVMGYYKDPEMTNECFRDGWFVTGDIVEVRNENEYYIIDRRKNLFKLAQGVFVAPSAIENKLLVSDFVHQIYVYGDHTRSQLVSIVVPNLETLAKWCVSHSHVDVIAWINGLETASDLPQDILTMAPENITSILLSPTGRHNREFATYLCSLPIAVAKVHREIVNTAQQIELPPYHIPAAISLEAEKWTTENRLVTPSDKPQRAALEKKYKTEIERLYQEAAAQESESALIVDQVKDVVGDVLATQGEASEGEDVSVNLATDSLSVLKLINQLNKKFGTNISFMDVMRETGGRLTPALIAEVIQRRSKNSTNLDTWSLQHPMILADLNTTIPVDQLLINDFYGTEDSCKEQRDADFKNIFLTGSTGFLGFHLLTELLEKYPNAQFWLLIRASSAEDAKARLVEDTAKKQKKSHLFASEAAENGANGSENISENTSNCLLSRINFLLGDLGAPTRLGLDMDVWNELSAKIDCIFHVGAAVNWMWGYETMRPPNVVGTFELLKLATTTRLKYFFFVSTASTSYPYAIVPAQPFTPYQLNWEDRGPLEETSLLSKDDCANMSAYVISKWVAETVVRNTMSTGLPGCIMRPGMITGHSESGACHSTDFCPRLLIGLCQSLSAFDSNLPLEWMPVDFCARATVTLASNYAQNILPVLLRDQGLGVVPAFNVQNFAMATYSQIVSYLQSAGIQVHTKEYKEWRKSVAEHPNSPLWPLLPFFGEDECRMYARPHPSPQTAAILQSHDVFCPIADETLFHTYVRYLKEEGLI